MTAIFTGSYVSVSADDWGDTVMLMPHLSNWVWAPPLLPPVCTAPDAMLPDLFAFTCRQLREAHRQGASVLALLVVPYESGLVLVFGADVEGMHGVCVLRPPDVHVDVKYAFQQCLDYCIGGAAALPVRVFAGVCSDALTSTPGLQFLPPAVGVFITKTAHLTLLSRLTAPSPYGTTPVVDQFGVVIQFCVLPLNPALRAMYIAVDELAIDPIYGTLLPVCTAELYNLTQWIWRLEPPLPAPREKLLPYTSAPALHEPLMVSLASLAQCEDPSTWVEQLGSMLHHPMVHACAMVRWTQIMDPEHPLTQLKLRTRLADPSTARQESEGIAFDQLFQGGNEHTVPAHWRPGGAGSDDAYLSMLCIHQWSHTLRCLVDLGERAGFVCAHLRAHRIGVVWQEAGDLTPVRAVYRRTGDGEHMFLFNPAPDAFTLSHTHTAGIDTTVTPGLQTQSARLRDAVVGFFVGHAVELLAPLMCPSKSEMAAAVLYKMYQGHMHQHTDLRYEYKELQRGMRALRQLYPVESSGPTRKRRSRSDASL